MDGVINIHKPQGPTSHDIVYKARRVFGQKRVGHAGTLDPMATGVLVVCLGKATRIVEYLMGAPKKYRAKMVLGQSSDTQDSTGVILSERDASGITRESFDEVIKGFVGAIDQVPPMVSALKHQGQPLYKLAREGKSIERAARMVNVYSIEVLDFIPGVRAEAEIMVSCGSGTYIRTLCHDIGDKLGYGGLMSMLERTQVGSFSIEDAVTLEELEQAKEQDSQNNFVRSINDSLTGFPTVLLNPNEQADVMHGIAISRSEPMQNGAVVRMLSDDGELVAIGIADIVDENVVIRPKKVLADVGA